MALLDFLKKPAPAAPAAPPVDQVLAMQQQGLANSQIVQALQRQGYDTSAIMDAMSQAEAKRGVEPMTPQPEEMPPLPSAPPAPARAEAFEEIAEHIVDEKWQDFTKEMGKMAEWKDSVNSRLDRLEQSMSDVKADLENLHKSIISRIGEYDKNLLDVGTEIKAMEKVFQKVLPTLTENVAELSRVTKQVKGPAKK
ncbi:hypothetical protein HY493_02005 [Candidatus Woesearchaeota archaeon]|nr:hypothetical protein [Candidatus Woesearchaeota archaeon]